METIIAAALYIEVPLKPDEDPWDPRRSMIILTLPPPARHHTLMHAGYCLKGEKPVQSFEQGFITSTGRYVNRFEGMDIALASGQPFAGEFKTPGKQLYSEHLW